MDQKEAAFWGDLNGSSADGGWPLVDAGTFEDEGLWKIQNNRAGLADGKGSCADGNGCEKVIG